MALNDEEKQAQRQLQEAIENHRRVFLKNSGLPEQSEVLADWLLIVSCVSYDDEGDPLVAYHLAMPDDVLLDHRAKGLAVQALDMFRFGQAVRDCNGCACRA